MRDIIQGYNRCIFRYIKDVVDHIEKSGDAIDTTAVICGIIVVSNVYLMSITHQCSSIYASTMTNKSITIYIDFMIQMNNIDSSPNSSLKLSCLDAAQFVYKKIFPSTMATKETSLMHPSSIEEQELCNNKLDTIKNGNVILYVDTENALKTLHQHNVFIRNITNVLFKLPVFYSEKLETTDYYSLVINKMLHLNSLVENIDVNSLDNVYKEVIQKQKTLQDQHVAAETDIESLHSYIDNIEQSITNKRNFC